MFIKLITKYFIGLFLVICPNYAYSAGFALMQQGTGPMGQGNAFVAQADDPSALFFNPAGISQLKGSQAYFGSTLIVPRLKYDGPNQLNEKTTEKIFVSPQMYLTQQISPQIYFGLGIFSPFGLGTYWDADWEGRYLATSSSLETINLNPNIVLKKGNLSLSAGFNALMADLELKKKLPFPSPYPYGESKIKDDTWGYGYNLGLLYHVNDYWDLGLSYRSEIKLNFNDGDANFEVPSALKSAFPDTEGDGDLDLPPSLTAGISFQPHNKWAFEVDVSWIGWSTYDEIKIEFDDPVNGQYSSVQPKKWKDVFSYRFGLKYRISEHYTLRAGYIFDEAPMPDSTLDPQLPNGDRHIYTAGFDWKLSNKTLLGVAYNFIYGKECHKDNEIMPSLPEYFRANGYYRQRIHSLAASFNYKF